MRGAAAYQAIVQETTPRHRLVEAVLERAIAHIARAEDAIAHRRVMEAHDALMRAQMAVGSLRVALRREAAPELVGQLSVLYGYVIDRLIQANVRKDASELPVLRQVLEPLREAFSEAASKEVVHG